MKDPNAMTVDECRDELARNAGWHYANLGGMFPHKWWRGHSDYFQAPDTCCAHHSTGVYGIDHPIPANLDEAARLPEVWVLDYVRERYSSSAPWFARAVRRYEETTTVVAEGTTELEARFRLRVAVERLARQGEGDRTDKHENR